MELLAAFNRGLNRNCSPRVTETACPWRRPIASARRAFPEISCGVYGYPVREAAKIAVTTIGRFLETDDTIEHVWLCCFTEESWKAYEEVVARLEM